MTYRQGAQEIGDGLWAYVQPDGGWGWSNAGLVTEGDASLLVDTLFDLKLTQRWTNLRIVTPPDIEPNIFAGAVRRFDLAFDLR